VDSTTFTFTLPSDPGSNASGTITAKYAPHASWSKAYSGTNKAAYKSTELGSTGCYLRVDDTANAQYANVRGYETMSDVDTGTGLFPTVAQISAGIYWKGSNASDSTARPWIIIADPMMIYLFASWTNATANNDFSMFGDIASYKSGDAYHAAIMGCSANPGSAIGASTHSTLISNQSQVGHYLARSYTQVGTAIQFLKYGPSISGVLGGAGAAYPNGADNGFHTRFPIDVFEGTTATNGVARGYLPGLYIPMHPLPLTYGDTVSSIIGLTGRTFLILKPYINGNAGTVAVDITGPWR
jgi:hypothetical protein